MAAPSGDWLDIPKPNPALENFVRTDDRLKRELFYTAMTVAARFQATARKGTGRMAASTVVGTEPTDYAPAAGRPTGTVRVTAPYTVWRLTGAGPGMHPRSTGKEPWGGPYGGDFTFKHIIEQMGGS